MVMASPAATLQNKKLGIALTIKFDSVRLPLPYTMEDDGSGRVCSGSGAQQCSSEKPERF